VGWPLGRLPAIMTVPPNWESSVTSAGSPLRGRTWRYGSSVGRFAAGVAPRSSEGRGGKRVLVVAEMCSAAERLIRLFADSGQGGGIALRRVGGDVAVVL